MKRALAMPFGASLLSNGGVRFRVWAPAAHTVAVRLGADGAGPTLPMQASAGGWFELATDAARAGSRYSYVINGVRAVPDPASRFQPDDVHGPSEVIDPTSFAWTDGAWRGRPWSETVLYELHVGTFTPDGTYAGVGGKLDYLVDLGVTAIELMPLSESPGRHNWGYDGVQPFAPESQYGRPEALKALIQAAHAKNLMVFVDVVYNHFGPEGNYLHLYAPQFFTDRHPTLWGAGINVDGPESRVVRDFFIHNALYWIEEFGIDGLRLDAVNAIRDDGSPHILIEMAETVRRAVSRDRHVHLVLENGENIATYLERGTDGGPRWYTAQWNDDLHHALHVPITGETGGYYVDYRDRRDERLGRALAEGFVYQGEVAAYVGSRARGQPSGHLPPSAFVSFLQNHDQIGNRAFGERIATLAEPAAVQAAVAIVLLAPAVPLLFMGEEWSAAQPFLFFCDFGSDLAQAVRDGRRREFARFPEFADQTARARIPDPNSPETFARAILDWTAPGREPHRTWLALYRRLLALRRREIVPRLSGIRGGQAHFELLGDEALRVEWRLGDGSRLTLIAHMRDSTVPAGRLEVGGRILHSTDADAAAGPLRQLPPWFVAWYLEDEPAKA
jgi:malto-oligosyltrehalose trehalohydrolase